MFKIGKDFHSFLGGVSHDDQGRIVSAQATLMFFFSRMNVTEAHLEQVQEQSILGDQVWIMDYLSVWICKGSDSKIALFILALC